jgi:hypothetical protein
VLQLADRMCVGENEARKMVEVCCMKNSSLWPRLKAGIYRQASGNYVRHVDLILRFFVVLLPIANKYNKVQHCTMYVCPYTRKFELVWRKQGQKVGIFSIFACMHDTDITNDANLLQALRLVASADTAEEPGACCTKRWSISHYFSMFSNYFTTCNSLLLRYTHISASVQFLSIEKKPKYFRCVGEWKKEHEKRDQINYSKV